MDSTPTMAYPLPSQRPCLDYSGLLPRLFPRGGRQKSIRWWPCDSSKTRRFFSYVCSADSLLLSSVSRLFCRAFSRALLRQIPAPPSRVGYAETHSSASAFRFRPHHRSPLKHPLALGAAASWLQGAPGKWARKAENLAISYLNSVSLIAFVGANPEQRQGRGNEWGSKVDWHRVCVMWNRASRHFAGR